jgi:hypothetical protein
MNYRPGQIVPQSGIYEELTTGGVKVTEVTCVKGEPFPPTEWNGYHYRLVRTAKHKPSKG